MTLPRNPFREELQDILDGLIPPANYRVVLDVCPDRERLRLRVLKAKPRRIMFMGRCIWTLTPNWESDKAVQREIQGRTYECLLTQLKQAPEFLEFEVDVRGPVVYAETALSHI